MNKRDKSKTNQFNSISPNGRRNMMQGVIAPVSQQQTIVNNGGRGRTTNAGGGDAAYYTKQGL